MSSLSYCNHVFAQIDQAAAEEFRSRDPNKIYWVHCMVCGMDVHDKYGDWYNFCDACGDLEEDIIDVCCRSSERDAKIVEFIEHCVQNFNGMNPTSGVMEFVIPPEFANFSRDVKFQFYSCLGGDWSDYHLSNYCLRTKKIYIKNMDKKIWTKK